MTYFFTYNNQQLQGNFLTADGNYTNAVGASLVVAGTYTGQYGGTVVIEEDGDFTYTPSSSNTTRVDNFEYTLLSDSSVHEIHIKTPIPETVGTEGNDNLTIGSQHNTIQGLGGNDILSAYFGGVLIDGGDGNDVMLGSSFDDFFISASGNDRIQAGGGYYYGGGVNDVVFIGNDVGIGDITFSRSDNLLDLVISVDSRTITLQNQFLWNDYFRDRVDYLEYGHNHVSYNLDDIFASIIVGPSPSDPNYGSTYTGSIGDDYIAGNGGFDILYGGDGDDVLAAASGGDEIYGGNGRDLIFARGAGIVSGGAGEDVIHDAGGIVHGNDGKDVIYAKGGTAYGDAGDDTLDARGGSNVTMYGDIGNDTLYGGGGTYDIIDGGQGNDYLKANGGMWSVADGGSGNDVIVGTGNLYGNTGNDLITSIGSAKMYGEDGNDIITGGNETDTIYGGNGYDVLYGAEGNDTLYGNVNSNSTDISGDYLEGGAGSDILFGTISGNDTLIADAGIDYLYGDNGANGTLSDDTFIVKNSSFSYTTHDWVYDFSETHDYLDLSDLLVNYNPATDDINDFVKITAHTNYIFGSSSYQGHMFSVDRDGTGSSYYDIIFAAGNPPTPLWTDTVEDLIASGHLIVDPSNSVGHANITNHYYSALGAQTLEGNVLAVDGYHTHATGTALLVAGTYATQRGGSVTVEADGDFTYTAPAEYTGPDLFSFSYVTGQNYYVSVAVDQATINGSQDNDFVYGNTTNDTLNGSAGSDYIYGRAGNDTINGGSGNDTLYGESGADNISGGDGNDTINGNADIDMIAGGNGDDILVDTSADANEINGGAGNDTITVSGLASGDAGNDTLTGSNTNDVLYGGAGSDTLYGDGNNDIIYGYAVIGTDSSGDIIYGGNGNDKLYGNMGADTIYGGDGVDEIYASDGDDYILDNTFAPLPVAESNLIYGGAGNDIIHATGTVYGEAGHDTITMYHWNGIAYGDDGDDIINNNGSGSKSYGGIGNDTITGGSFIEGNDGNDIIYGGGYFFGSYYGNDGDDEMHVSAGLNNDWSYAYGGNGNDSITGNNNVEAHGADGDDTLLYLAKAYGGSGADYIYSAGIAEGGDGNDIIINSGYAYGGADNDQITMLNADPSSRSYTYGGDGNDTITSQLGGDYIEGGSGNDSITTGGGLDDVYAGDGADTIILTGTPASAGHDRIYLNETSTDERDVVVVNLGVHEFINHVYSFNDADAIDLSPVLDNYNPAIHDLDLFVRKTVGVDYTLISTDPTGTGTYFHPSIKIEGRVFTESLQQMISNGNVIVKQAPSVPVAEKDEFLVSNHATLTGNLLANNGHGADSDPDGHTLSVVAATLTTANGGSVVINADGTFTYAPVNTYVGSDTFTYTLKDSTNLTDTGTVVITVVENQDPVAANDIFTTSEDTVLTGNALANNGNGVDSDSDADVLIVTAGTFATAHGSVTIDADGDFTYTPNADYNGSDSFEYTITDPEGGSDTATASITVTAVNDAPVAQNDEIDSAENRNILGNVLANNGHGADSDMDGDTLTVTAGIFATAHGSVTIEADGDFIYTPDADYEGADNFDYTISDGNGGVDTATVNLTVQPFSNRYYAVLGSEALQANLLTNDGYYTNTTGTALLVAGTYATQKGGTIVVEADGDFTYTAPTGYTGTDMFRYAYQAGEVYYAQLHVNQTAITGTGEHDYVYGQSTSDTLTGTGGHDRLYGRAGNDIINGGADQDWLHGEDGNDTINGGAGTDMIYGGAGNDTLEDTSANPNPNEINGGDGDDIITVRGIGSGDAGSDTLYGSDGNDVVYGGAGNDTLYGGDGDDSMEGDFFYDELEVQGNDTIYGGQGGDYIRGRGGNDYIEDTVGGTNPLNKNHIFGDEGEDTIIGSGFIYGGAHADNLTGSSEDDEIWGEQGFDVIHGMGGNDLIYGGGTDDTIYGGDGNDTIYGYDNITGNGSGTDYIEGGNGTDRIYGNSSRDDTLIFDAGGDTITGDTGADMFIVKQSALGNGLGIATDFDRSVDVIDFVALLDNYDPTVDDINDFLKVEFGTRNIGSNSYQGMIFSVDANGTGSNYVDVVLAERGSAWSETLQQLITSGHVIVKTAPSVPVAETDEFLVSNHVTLNGNLLANNGNGADHDPEGHTLSVVAATLTTVNGGSVTINTDGTFTYTPVGTCVGTDTFTYTLKDSTNATDTGTVTITVVENQAPVAVADAFTTNEDTVLTGNVLANNGSGVDSDSDADALIVIAGTFATVHGSVTIDEDGNFTYTPNANYNGSDSFEYTITDPEGGSDTATVNITITAVNDVPVAQNDEFEGDEDTAITGNLLANNGNGADSDIESNTLTVTAGTYATAHGSVTIEANGDFTYTPAANYNGTDNFGYTISDGNGGTDTATVDLTINAINDAPVAKDDTFERDEDTSVTGNVLADNGNGTDSDIENNTLIVTAGTYATAHGSVIIDTNGDFTYTPNANYNGSDSFEYTISDGNGGTDTATVTIDLASVNDAPVAQNDVASGNEDTVITGNLFANNGNGTDSDADGDMLSVSAGTYATTHGSIVVESDGEFTYTPNVNYNGTDSYEYTLSDGNGGTDTATLSLTVNTVNDAPLAKDDVKSGNEDTAITGNVLADNGNGADSDIDGDTLTVQAGIIASAMGGSVALLANGDFTYTPAANFNGTDSFTYTVSDGNSGTDTATVSLTVNAVNDNPVAKIDSFTGNEDTVITGNLLNNNGSGEDSDADGDTLSVQAGTYATVHGSVTILSNGDFTYTPTANYNGTDSFNYTLQDGNGGTATGSANLTINAVNDNPVAQIDVISGSEDAVIIGNVLANNGNGADSDIEGHTLSVTAGSFATTYGSVTIVSNGNFTYTPNANYNGPDSFNYTLNDGNGGTATGTVNVTVNPINDAPVVSNNGGTVALNTVMTLTTTMLSATDHEQAANSLVFALSAVPAWGTLKYDGIALGVNDSFTKQDILDGKVTYTPVFYYAGADSFSFTTSDGTASVPAANFSISVTTTMNLIHGTPATETLNGTGVADLIWGHAGVNTIYTGNGNDVVIGGQERDDINPLTYTTTGDKLIYANGGDDRVSTGGGNDTVYGGDGSDTVNGHAGNDTLYGGNGIDYLSGAAGNDVIFGDDGDDWVMGWIGNDVLYGGNGSDDLWGAHPDGYASMSGVYGDHTGVNNSKILNGGAGNDRLYGYIGDDIYVFNLGDGQDVISDAGGSVDKIKFGPGITFERLVFTNVGTYNTEITFMDSSGDKITISNQRNGTTYKIDKILLDNGTEYSFPIVGTSATETITGTTGSDLIYGNAGTNTIYTNNGDDIIIGGEGYDDINPSSYNYTGNKTIYGNGGDDRISAGAGNDTIYGGNGIDNINGHTGNDTIYGGNDVDYLSGSAGDDTIYGDEGDDWVMGWIGNDILYGGNGNDDIWAAHPDGYASMSIVYGAHTGADNAKTLYGEAGNDMLRGYIGNDILEGGAGVDSLYGSTGADVFVYNPDSLGSKDTIHDFSKTENDKLDLSGLLDGYDSSQHAINDFVSFTTSSGNTTMRVDQDGLGTTHAAQDVVTINGQTWTSVSAMITSGHLIVED